MRIRPYEPRDFPQLVALGGDMHAESDFRVFDFAVSSLEALSDLVLARKDLVCFVAEKDTRIVGMFVGGVAPFFFGPDLYAFDMVLYVGARWRGTSAAIRLISAFHEWAKLAGAKQIRIGQATGINPEVVDAVFTKLGYRRGGTLYTRAVP